MDETKQLFNTAVSAIFSAMLLGAVFTILGASYLLWRYFDRQDSANSAIADYANLTAFDNTTLRGSEVENLLTVADNLDIYVVFMDTESSNTVLNDCTAGPIRYIYADPQGSAYNVINNNMSTENAVIVCSSALTQVKTSFGSLSPAAPASNVSLMGTNLYGQTHAQLTSLLTSASGLGSQAYPDAAGNPIDGYYGVFKSVLIYTGQGSTDVAGIGLIRATKNVMNYCLP